jgi:hypothetical protein
VPGWKTLAKVLALKVMLEVGTKSRPAARAAPAVKLVSIWPAGHAGEAFGTAPVESTAPGGGATHAAVDTAVRAAVAPGAGRNGKRDAGNPAGVPTSKESSVPRSASAKRISS